MGWDEDALEVVALDRHPVGGGGGGEGGTTGTTGPRGGGGGGDPGEAGGDDQRTLGEF